MVNTATTLHSHGPFVAPEQGVVSVRQEARVRPEARALYPWVDPEAWYPSAMAHPGTNGYLLLTVRGPRFVFQWHYDVRLVPAQESRPPVAVLGRYSSIEPSV